MFSIDSEKLGFAALVLVVGATYWFSKDGAESPSLAGTVAVDSHVEQHWLQTSKDADATTVITHNGGQDGDQLHLYRQHWGGLRADPEDLEKKDASGRRIWGVEDTLHYGVFHPGIDVGTFAGYTRWDARHDLNEFQVGLRVSPIRLLYGIIAVDGLITSQAGGAGVSFYLPSFVTHDTGLNHLGVGVGRLYSFHHGEVGNAVYSSFSTEF